MTLLTQLQLLDEYSINQKIKQISEILKDKRVIVAFSGGVDSTVMALFAKQFATETLLVMQTGLSVSLDEEIHASNQAEQLDLVLRIIKYNEFDLSKDYIDNPPNRCYYCKVLLHSFLEEIRSTHDFDFVVSGLNHSDTTGHRPGYQALKEFNVRSPLLDVKLTKSEIRWIARKHDLYSWDKPAMACLASRFMTGVRISEFGLRRIALAEKYIKSTFNISILRVRDHGNNHARIEVGIDELKKIIEENNKNKIIEKMNELGFVSVKIDPNGYRPNVPRNTR